jgi:hypothetical protein
MVRFLQKDIAVGLLCMAVAAFGLIQGRRYPIGTSDEMGPGYFPLVIFSALMICGLAMLLVRLARPGEMLDRWAWRPLGAVMTAIIFFGLTVETLGFVLSCILTVAIATCAEKGAPWKNVLTLSLTTAAGAALLFVVLLGLSLPLWPLWLRA